MTRLTLLLLALWLLAESATDGRRTRGDLDERLSMRLVDSERDAPFGHVRNRRAMLLAADGRRIDSYRENLPELGDRHSSWQETWARVE